MMCNLKFVGNFPILLLVVISAMFNVVIGELVEYPDDQVIRIYKNSRDHDVIKEYIRPKIDDYDVWTNNEKFVDLRVPHDLNLEISHDCLIANLSQAIHDTFPDANEQQPPIENDQTNFNAKGGSNFFFDQFRDLETIYLWYELLEKSFPDLVTIELVGKTYENRDIKALHISAKNPLLNPEKKTIVITGGVHAREWITVSSACYTIYQLLSRYGKKKQETKYLNSLDFLVIPVFNPDGYVYSWQHDRLWRKNRQQTYMPLCHGVDIDHSFDYHWTSTDGFPCSEDYSGEEPFEAIEAQSWNNYLNTTKGEYKIYGYLDFHSYSQEVLYPYAYSCEAQPRDLENLVELSYGIAKVFKQVNGNKYEVIKACEDRGSDLTPGLGSGSALDYMYHHRAYWAFQFKLFDTGNHGFLLPPKYITPVGKETYAGIRYFCNFILNPDL